MDPSRTPENELTSALRRHWFDAILMVVCLAVVVVGFTLYGVCNGGDSLILFGVAVAFLAAVLFRLGAWATVIPLAIVTVALIGGGWYGATVAGCSL